VEVRDRVAGKATELEKRILDAPQTMGSLMNLWKYLAPKLHKEVPKGLFFSKKEQRFFKMFMERVGYKPLLVAACLIKNWGEYVDHCKSHAGAYKPPLSPKIEFLVGYINEAMYIFERHKNGRAADVLVDRLVNMERVDEARDIATKEDIQRVLEEIDGGLRDSD